MEKFLHGAGWFNSFLAHMHMKPLADKHQLIDLVAGGNQDIHQAVTLAWERLPAQLDALRDTGAARASKRGRWVCNLPIGQVAWKSGFSFRNARPYLHLWLNGVLVYSEN